MVVKVITMDLPYRMALRSFAETFRYTEPRGFSFYRGISAGLSWNFGKLKENVSKKKGVNNVDQIGGGQGTSN